MFGVMLFLFSFSSLCDCIERQAVFFFMNAELNVSYFLRIVCDAL